MQWKKTTVIRADKKRVSARAPVIISASRATDIPAFYTDWLINRLNAGYAVWVNPFNNARLYYVSFEAARLFVFWTKNPGPLIRRLDEFEKRNIHYYFQVTLNDYETEKFEPGLPPLHERIHTFRELSDRIGRHRVIWRFDPLIVTPRLSPERLLEKIAHIGNRLMHKTDKLVISFVDVDAYPKVRNNLVRELDLFDSDSVVSAEPSWPQIRRIARGLEQLRTHWKRQGWNITVATCGESMDLETDYGIVKNRCIDDDLIRNVFSHDRELMQFVDYGETDPEAVRQREMFAAPRTVNIKDKGQRKACNCISSKDIGMYNTCPHFCVYCYANTSRNRVTGNLSKHSARAESLIENEKGEGGERWWAVQGLNL